jgi:hypothetical protein
VKLPSTGNPLCNVYPIIKAPISPKLQKKLKILKFYTASINSKCIKALTIRSETVKLIQEKIGNTLDLIGMRNMEWNSNS